MKEEAQVRKALAELLHEEKDIQIMYSEPYVYGSINPSLWLKLNLRERRLEYGNNDIHIKEGSLTVEGQILSIEYLNVIQTLKQSSIITETLKTVESIFSSSKNDSNNLTVRYGQNLEVK